MNILNRFKLPRSGGVFFCFKTFSVFFHHFFIRPQSAFKDKLFFGLFFELLP